MNNRTILLRGGELFHEQWRLWLNKRQRRSSSRTMMMEQKWTRKASRKWPFQKTTCPTQGLTIAGQLVDAPKLETLINRHIMKEWIKDCSRDPVVVCWWSFFGAIVVMDESNLTKQEYTHKWNDLRKLLLRHFTVRCHCELLEIASHLVVSHSTEGGFVNELYYYIFQSGSFRVTFH